MLTLECRDVSHFYGSVSALDQINVSRAGSGVVALIGANGAGKSTLLRGLVGAHRFSSGEVYIASEAMYPESLARRHIGYLSERAALAPDLSVAEIITNAALARGFSRRQARAAVVWALERCDLLGLSARLCQTLSRGQSQRARIASTLVHRPPILILDEVHSGLDPIQTRELNLLISELAREHLIVLSTHRLGAAECVADTYWVLDQGRLVARGPLNEWSSKNRGSAEEAYYDLIERSSSLT